MVLAKIIGQKKKLELSKSPYVVDTPSFGKNKRVYKDKYGRRYLNMGSEYGYSRLQKKYDKKYPLKRG